MRPPTRSATPTRAAERPSGRRSSSVGEPARRRRRSDAMKARSASLTLYHFADGHHREVCIWHDQDHKPEVVATTPGIFISQRWVAPPELMAARSPSTL